MPGRNIHPFPARMAPELALDALARVGAGATVLDPMCGSGTVLRHAIGAGHHALGFDLDPLAVLITRVSCRRLRPDRLRNAAERAVVDASRLRSTKVRWIDSDPETSDFVDYWFATEQQADLRRLARVLHEREGPVADALRLALSGTIITKDRGASLARDVSHSRPHRVRDANTYDVMRGFLAEASRIAGGVGTEATGTARVRRGDARCLPTRFNETIDLVVTSPPYLNAIDYMRGHRMSLVWLGHRVGDLRRVRANAVGAERAPDCPTTEQTLRGYSALSSRNRAMLERYAVDMAGLAATIHRTLKPGGEAVLVVGDCTVGGVYVRNSTIVRQAHERAGLELVSRRSRALPSGSRYLPPPSSAGVSALANRLRHEVVLRFRKPTV